MAEQWPHEVGAGKQLGVGRAPEVWSQLLVEEVLELERATPLRRILGVQRWLWPALLDRGDDSGRVAD
jgi:hypothetical protein